MKETIEVCWGTVRRYGKVVERGRIGSPKQKRAVRLKSEDEAEQRRAHSVCLWEVLFTGYEAQ